MGQARISCILKVYVAAVLLACVLQAALLSAQPRADHIQHDQHDLRAAEMDMAEEDEALAKVDRANIMTAAGVTQDRFMIPRSDLIKICIRNCNGKYKTERQRNRCADACRAGRG